jgi:PAS domain S-box-containing protein
MSDKKLLRILFIEDLPSDVDLAVLELKRENLKFEHQTVCSRKDLIKAIGEFEPDLIISDYMMPSYNGLQALKDVKKINDSIPFILYTGSINEEIAVRCLKEGADDYIIKEHLTRLPFAVKEALEQAAARSEKKIAENELISSFSLLNASLESTADGIMITDGHGGMRKWNKKFLEMWDIPMENMVNQKDESEMQFIYDKILNVEEFKKTMYEVIHNPEKSSFDRVEFKDGRYFERYSLPQKIDDKVVGRVWSFRNVTESVKAQIELKKLSSAVEQNPASIVITDFDGNIEYVNPKGCEITGYTKEELIGKNPRILSGGDKTISEYKELWDTIKSGKVWEGEFHNKKKNGDMYWESASITPIKNSKGDIINFLAIKENITERKSLEEARKASEQRYHELFLSNPFPIYIFDTDTLEFIEVNNATVDNYGYTREEFAKMTLKDLRVPEDIPELIEYVKKLGNEPAHSTHMRHRRKDGSVFPVENTSYVLPDKQGRKTRLSMTLDISERVKAAEQMKLAFEKAEASDKLKTTFLNNISHEVRTPLNGILGFAELLTQPDLTEEEKSDSLDMLRQGSNRLLNTITNYVDISLLTTGTMSHTRKEVKPAVLLSRVCEDFNEMIVKKGLKLSLNVPGDKKDFTISSDPEILIKILHHLLSNAVYFTEKGGIDVGYTLKDNFCEFFVRDTGIGISQKSIGTIFDHFIKEERDPTKPSEGSGLGLSIAKGMIELLGGKINVESKINSGSMFTFIIPVNMENIEHFSGKSESETKVAVKSRKILVAEDDDANFYYINAVLKRETDAEVLHAINGKEAIDLYKRNPGIDLIIMDIKMPILDGLEATRQIKAINKEVPIVALTAYAMVGDEKKILDAGCDGYLSKPINKKIFIEKISEFIKI